MKKSLVIQLDDSRKASHKVILDWLSSLPADNRGVRYQNEIVELLANAIQGKVVESEDSEQVVIIDDASFFSDGSDKIAKNAVNTDKTPQKSEPITQIVEEKRSDSDYIEPKNQEIIKNQESSSIKPLEIPPVKPVPSKSNADVFSDAMKKLEF